MSIYLDQIFLKTIDFFKEKGFRLLKSKESYEKKEGEFKFKLNFLSHKRTGETAIEVFVYIEHIPTAKIYKKATSFNLLLSTIGNEIGRIKNNDDGKIKSHYSENIRLFSEEDVIGASQDVIDIFENVAEPYFEKYGNLKTLDKILNDYPDIISVHRNDQYNRYALGLIVAKLNNRENYKELEKEYDKLIIDMSEMYIERYNQVKTYLKEL